MPCRSLPKVLVACLLLLVALSAPAHAADGIPLRYSLAGAYATSFNTSGDIDFAMAEAGVSTRFDDLFGTSVSDDLRLKLEAGAGASTSDPSGRFVGEALLGVQYYIPALATATFKPYVEAGFGIGFTDFEVARQGTRCNFLSQGGVGADIVINADWTAFAGVQVQHLSNADTNDDNRGMNVLRFTLGTYF